MKLPNFRIAILIFAALQLVSCGDFMTSRYVLTLPEAPEAWVSLLGEAHWRIEWLRHDGKRQIKDILPGETLAVDLPATWVNPVTAWPYWPEHKLIPGLFYPAGALFPFDVSGNNIVLTWEAGVDVVFYKNLALSAEQNGSKMPAYFDWQRFRELLTADTDLWLVDWQYVADRTLSSNFDRRRLVPQAVEMMVLPVPEGTWYGMSPFAEPLILAEGEGFPVCAGLNVWISDEGILRVNGKTWVFTAW